MNTYAGIPRNSLEFLVQLVLQHGRVPLECASGGGGLRRHGLADTARRRSLHAEGTGVHCRRHWMLPVLLVLLALVQLVLLVLLVLLVC